ncbi:MAG: sugar ABC transporter substrate-binding protein [Spirochaetes bacterium]|nr:sugar ABC transporter substrate-binding protein [Spirochaetota bacterium]
MKKVVKLALLLLVASSMTFLGCGQRQDDGVMRVAFIARTQGDSFAAWLANSISEEAARFPNLNVTIMDGQGNDAWIMSLVENSIVNRFDIIIVQPNNSEAQRPAVQQVVNAGIPAVTVNLRIPGMEDVSHSVDADPFEQGAVNARLGFYQIPQNGYVVVLNGPAGHMHSIERRRAWQEEFFDRRPDVTILGEQFANWNNDEAMNFMEDWVQAHAQIDAVISMNDNMAAGAIEVIRGDARFSNLLVYGVDGTAEAALLIEEGLMTATSFQNAHELARITMNLANDILTGNVTGYVNVDIDCPLITAENVHLLIDAHVATGAIIR